MYFSTAKEMEQLDRLAVADGLEIRQMMELAGWHMLAVFERLKIGKDTHVVVVTGKGNKGGDGLSASRHLVNHGWHVQVVLLDKEISLDSSHHLKLLEKMHVPITLFVEKKEWIEQADILIDGLIGYHLEGAPRGVFKDAIKAMNHAGKKIISYDVPSGVDPTTGECLDLCIQAFATLSLAMPKKVFETKEGRAKSGKIFIADIGIPKFLYNKIHPGSRPSFEEFEGSLVEL